MAKILAIGDIMGRPGRRALAQVLPMWKEEYKPDVMIGNVENLAHGKGITLNTMAEMEELGFDAYTAGNHIFDTGPHAQACFDKYDKIVRPDNYIGEYPGTSYYRFAKNGEAIRKEITPEDGVAFGRIAAQTAKQVIIQKLREAERTVQFSDFKAKERTLVNGIIQRVEGDTVLVDLGKGVGVLFPSEQIRGERYEVNQRIKVLILHVEPATRGPKITLSRSHPDIVRKLFEMEVPEIFNGTVEIKAVAREAGSRSKIAVMSTQDGIDPIGACVGQKGTRVQTIMAELGGEKIDIIEWSDDHVKFIANSLSPAKILNVQLDLEEKEAKVGVLEDQLSLAIGKAGQNVRLAARLTGWKIDISGEKIGSDNSTAEAPENTVPAVEAVEEGVIAPETPATKEAEFDEGGVSEGSLHEAEDPAQQMMEKGE